MPTMNLSLLFFLLISVPYLASGEDLKYERGDVIGCIVRLHIRFRPRVFWLRHWMLAADDHNLIHLVKHYRGMSAGRGTIRLDNREQAQLKKKKCKNFGKPYKLSREEAVSNALKYVDSEHDFNMFSCNCQHCVNKWTKGRGGYSTASLWWASRSCDAY